jgi:hypothetical protein
MAAILEIKKCKYYCKECNIETDNKNNYDKHLLTAKHSKVSNFLQKCCNYCCENCEFITNNKNNYNKHLLTAKHLRKLSGNEILQNLPKILQNHNRCEICEKIFTTPSGLWKHKKNVHCEINKNENNNETKSIVQSKKHDMSDDERTFMTNLIVTMIKENKEMQMQMQQTMLEMVKNVGNNNNNINTINNDNKSFNLNFFLNETCKNAMNLSDFVNGVDISLDDFEETGRIGYVEGLSRVFCKELKKLHFSERPIHCSDLKRETIYIRENNRWEKDENKEKLLRAVKQIGKKNIKVLTLWQEKYPGYKDVESKENDRYLHILTNIMCGETEEEIESNYGKIMKNISRITVVNKNGEK